MGSNSTLAYLAARVDAAAATRDELVDRLEEVYAELYEARGMLEEQASLLVDEDELRDEIKTCEASLADNAFRIAELEENLALLAGEEPALAAALLGMRDTVREAKKEAVYMQECARSAAARTKQYQEERDIAQREKLVMANRMLAWEGDKTAAQTADEYRAKYDAASRELAAMRVAVARALTVAGASTTRSKVAQGAFRLFEVTMNVAVRKALEGTKRDGKP
jgi:chromosome segregation ATPase